jgi:hypothetical protein
MMLTRKGEKKRSELRFGADVFILTGGGRWSPHHRSFPSGNPGKTWKNPASSFFMGLLPCQSFTMAIAARQNTVLLRMAAPTERRTSCKDNGT